jgi:hypothetical protein
VEGTCPRCGGAAGISRFCETCGKELTGQPSLPTDEALAAGRREAVWLAAHPEVADAERQSAERQAAERQAATPQAAPPHTQYGAGTLPPPVHVPPVRFDPARDPAKLAQIARLLLIAQAVLAVVTVAVEALYLNVLAGTTAEDYPFSVKVDDMSVWLGLLYIVQFLALLVTAGFFIAWLHRVYKNTQPLGAYELRHGTGWAIGGWFVPILSWWRPKQIVNDAWRASNPELGVQAHRREWEDAPVPASFLLWWLLFNLYSVMQQITGQLLYQDELTLEEDRTATIISMFSAVPGIAAALLAVHVIDRVTARQKARASARERMAPPTPPTPWGPPPSAPPPMWGTPPQPAPAQPTQPPQPTQWGTPPTPPPPGESSPEDPPPPPQQWLPPGGQV